MRSHRERQMSRWLSYLWIGGNPRDEINMLMAIFGAGASYDSVDLHLAPNMKREVELGISFRPPLANQLFDERPDFIAAMNRHPEMSMLIPRLRWAAEGSGKAVEEVLREIQEEAQTYPLRKSHLMALEFYLADILNEPVTKWLMSTGRATNYAGLLDQIKYNIGDSPFLFVTFNYDFMLEHAFGDVLLHYFSDDLNSYLGDNLALIKPHGSVDWAQQLGTSSGIPIPINGTLEQAAIEAAARPDLVASEVIFKSALNQPWHPAIAIPLDRGKTFVCPQNHLERLSSDLGEVTHILIVGWRATEQHFISKLKERLPKNQALSLCIVDKGDGGKSTLNNLQDSLPETISFGQVEIYSDGFSEFVRRGQVRKWISGAMGSR
jgi:hypothetical protein